MYFTALQYYVDLFPGGNPMGKTHLDHPMSLPGYLPYPVVAGFLAMIGAAVIKGAFKILLADKQGESEWPGDENHLEVDIFHIACGKPNN